MKKLVVIFLLMSLTMSAQYNKQKKKEEAWLKIGVGAYMHAMSGIFLMKDLRGPSTKPAFIFMNVACIQIDLIGVVQLFKIKRNDRKRNV